MLPNIKNISVNVVTYMATTTVALGESVDAITHSVDAQLGGVSAEEVQALTDILQNQDWPTDRSAKFKFRLDPLLLVEDTQDPSSPDVWDWDLMDWVDPRSLQEIKTAKWTELKQARSQAEYAGFTWDGSVFDSNAISQQRITGAVTLAQMDAGFSIDWTLADNTVRPLNAAQMKEVGTALGAHVATQFAHAQDLRTQLDAAQTVEEVAALGW